MNIPQFFRWTRIRKLGRQRFNIVFGVLIFGFPVGAALVAWFSYLEGRISSWTAAVGFCPALVGGYIFGAVVWTITERKYRKMAEQLIGATDAWQPKPIEGGFAPLVKEFVQKHKQGGKPAEGDGGETK